MKALGKDRARRYERANGFANDIPRCLDDQPVVACPPSPGYRLRKFARRNKGALAMAMCLAAAATIAGSFVLVAHWRSLREAEVRLGLRQAELDKRELESKAQEAERQRRQQQARLEAERRAKELEAAEQEARFNALVEEALRVSSAVHADFPRAEDLLTEVIERRPAEARLYNYHGRARHELGKCISPYMAGERVEQNPNPVLRIAGDGVILYANSASAPLLTSWNGRCGEPAPPNWSRRAAALLASGKVEEMEVTCEGRVFSASWPRSAIKAMSTRTARM